jgi:hypothetical protein
VVVLITDAERRTLGALAKEIGTKAVRGLDPLVSPATLLRWHRELFSETEQTKVLKKFDCPDARHAGR